MSEKKSVFTRLSKINVNDHTEKKNNKLTYLSWVWAWSKVKQECPDATYSKLPTEYDEVLGYMCHTEVTIEGETLEMWLPVMDGANKAMKSTSYTYETKFNGQKTVESATMFDINKAAMRCLVKNLAMFGLGIYIYAGEDLPESEAQEIEAAKIEAAKPKFITLKKDDDNWKKVVSYINANKSDGAEKIIATLSTKYTISAPLKTSIKKLVNEEL
jgi:hypothetical protein